MTELIYGVKGSGQDDLAIEIGQVRNNTAKQIVLERHMSSYAFRKQLSKIRDRIAYTPQDAVRFFVQEKLGQIARLQTDIDRLNDHIEQAKRLLDD